MPFSTCGEVVLMDVPGHLEIDTDADSATEAPGVLLAEAVATRCRRAVPA